MASQSAPEPRPKNTEEASRQFESLLIAQMLRSVRESMSGGFDPEGQESGENGTMMDMAEQQFAKVLAQNGGIGLTRLMMQGLQAAPAPPDPAAKGH